MKLKFPIKYSSHIGSQLAVCKPKTSVENQYGCYVLQKCLCFVQKYRYLSIGTKYVRMDLACPPHLSMWAALKTTSNSSLSNWAAFFAISAASKSRDSSSKNWPEEKKKRGNFILYLLLLPRKDKCEIFPLAVGWIVWSALSMILWNTR